MRSWTIWALTFGFTFGLCQLATAEVQTKTITYRDGDLECRGYLAFDDSLKTPRPGVLVVHEWWGLDDYARRRTRELAELGYVAFAADMYGAGKTVNHPRDAGEMAGTVRANITSWRARAQAALNVLKSQPECDASRISAMGYCFGGSTVLQLAYSGADLKSVATFHAALPAASPAEAKAIQGQLLICNGADDTFIPAAAIEAFRKELDAAGTSYEFVSYPKAVHSFTVPDSGKHKIPGMEYQAAADKDSWAKLKDLLEKTLR